MLEGIFFIIGVVVLLWLIHPSIKVAGVEYNGWISIIKGSFRYNRKVKTIPDIKPEPQGPYR